MSNVYIETRLGEIVKLSEQATRFEEDDEANFDNDSDRERFWLIKDEEVTVFCDYIDQYTKEQIQHIKNSIKKGLDIKLESPKFRIDLYSNGGIVNDYSIEWHEAFEINKKNDFKYGMVMTN